VIQNVFLLAFGFDGGN